MTLEMRSRDFLGLVDPGAGTVDRRIFSDKEIYQIELERIFARTWNFMAHDSQIPNPGDFFMTYIGEDRVIVVRDNDMQPQVVINSCRHRGNAVCRAEEGHATSFMCTYHGWTYDLKGNLVGVPGFKEVYHEELDRENWGLIKAAQVASYEGFIFANMDPDAPSLDEYLGEVGRLSIQMLSLRGDMEVIPGVQKYIIPCNWKLAADNVWDWHHAVVSHASAVQVGYGNGPDGKNTNTAAIRFKQNMFVSLGKYGHAISGPVWDPSFQAFSTQNPDWRQEPEVQKKMGPIANKAGGHPHIFPNLWFTGAQMSIRFPKGPDSTEIWWFTLRDRRLDADKANALRNRTIHTFGPAGMLEQEDGENWGESTKATRGVVSERYPLNYQMNMGLAKVIHQEGSPLHVETNVNEHAQLWLYRAWSEWMAAEDWETLRTISSNVPESEI